MLNYVKKYSTKFEEELEDIEIVMYQYKKGMHIIQKTLPLPASESNTSCRIITDELSTCIPWADSI